MERGYNEDQYRTYSAGDFPDNRKTMRITKDSIQKDFTYDEVISVQKTYDFEIESTGSFTIGEQVVTLQDCNGEVILTFLLTGYSNKSVWTLVWISDKFITEWKPK